MAAVQGPFQDADDPSEAVAAAMFRQGIEPGHVVVVPLADTGTRAWRWKLTSDAPMVLLRDVLVFREVVDRHGCTRVTGRAHHPKLTAGVVVEVDGGLLVVVGDDEGGEQVEDLIAAGLDAACWNQSTRR